MARSRSSLGLFGIFGRSADLRQMDQALRSVDVHPRLVPEAVKLTAVALLKDHAIGPEPAPQSYRAAAEILAYCMIGAEAFAGANDADLTHAVSAASRRRWTRPLDSTTTGAANAARQDHPAERGAPVRPGQFERLGTRVEISASSLKADIHWPALHAR